MQAIRPSRDCEKMLALLFLSTAIVCAASAETFQVLHSFTGPDGNAPQAKLIEGNDGNFYGTTAYGGDHSLGTVFRVTPGGTVTVIYSFCALADCADGSQPFAGL